MPKSKKEKYIFWFDEIDNKDIELVGGKNASLGEMYQKLTKNDINIPNGFAVSAYAYRYFISKAGIEKGINKILKKIDNKDVKDLADKAHKIRELILGSNFPKDLEEEIVSAYKKLSDFYNKEDIDVSARSSATAEDLPEASFAGQLESYLNIKGRHSVLKSVKKCIASLFTGRAVSYRIDKGFKHKDVSISVGIQKMVRSDKASAGVMFTIDTESGFQNVILINSSYGLGENVVKGKVNPDQFYVFETTLKKGFEPIIKKELGDKNKKVVYKTGGGKPTANVDVAPEDRKKYSLSEDEILRLARWGLLIEEHYKKPMDIEWAKDGLDGKLYIVQARPETVHGTGARDYLEKYRLKKKGNVLCAGEAIGSKIGKGNVQVVKDVSEIHKFKEGQILVTEMTDPDWEPIMKKASAIVTNSGGRTSHAAIVSRELGVPCIVGTGNATSVLKSGQKVTVSCAEGETGRVYKDLLDFDVKKTSLKKVKKPKTQIMMNLSNPEVAFNASFIPNEGVGLAREELIIGDYIKIHPLALLNFKKIKDKEAKNKINELTFNYKDKSQFFIDKLAEGVGRIAAAFYPKDVIVRFSDFKSNEYANLIGGRQFEPKEGNPMLGWRGASRYYDEKFRPAFGLECKAIKKAREVMGLSNIKVMIPFCRTTEEAKKVLKIMSKEGLKRGEKELEVYVMVEIPSNVVLAEEFSKHFDGFSIGSNDLTQLALGVDRDSQLVSHIYDERNEAVKKLISQVIKTAKKEKIKIGICGQAPSDFPDFAKFLVKEGIDSISLNPDTVVKTTKDIYNLENK